MLVHTRELAVSFLRTVVTVSVRSALRKHWADANNLIALAKTSLP